MSKLIVIGNGFDMSHGFDTSYNCFRDWLCNGLEARIDDEIIDFPRFQTNYKRMDSYDQKEMSFFFYKLIYNIIEDDWSGFETALAFIDWAALVDEQTTRLKWTGGFEPQDLVSVADDFASELRNFAFILTDHLFPNWVSSINISAPARISNEFKSVINPVRDHFLTFNYTDTLEKHYNISNACYIHGRSSTHKPLVVGHGRNYEEFSKVTHKNVFHMLNVYYLTKPIFENYKKDVLMAHQTHLPFFFSLREIDEILIHGFSFSEVDMFYLKKIAETVNPEKIAIQLHSYKKIDWPNFRDKLLSIGFKMDNIKPFRLTDLNDTEMV